MGKIRFKYRNTGFMRQMFIWIKRGNKWRYKGIEFNRSYFRVYELTDEGTLPRFRDLYGATKRQKQVQGSDLVKKDQA
jgi:hypothetical protein